jgi:hypothetical protein
MNTSFLDVLDVLKWAGRETRLLHFSPLSRDQFKAHRSCVANWYDGQLSEN